MYGLPPTRGLIFASVMPRHSLFRRLVSLQLAMLVLAASVGLTVQTQTCRMSGRSQTDISIPGRASLAGCRAPEAASVAPVAEDDCCDISSHLHKVLTPAHELAAKTLVAGPLLAVLEPSLLWHRPQAAGFVGKADQHWSADDASPPPLGGRRFLAWVCTLVV
jgi:hypothetical protein